MEIRRALPGESERIGALRLAAYGAQSLLDSAPDYAGELARLGTEGPGTVLVATDGADLLGTVMLEPWHAGSEVAADAAETEVRAFAVDPGAQRRGIGRALMAALEEHAAAAGARRVVLSTQPAMHGAHRLYASLGYTRLPQRDWTPVPGLTLLAYAKELRPR
ncbi:GNAT family N-acetyltransferase [Nocardiopsis coralliicola]